MGGLPATPLWVSPASALLRSFLHPPSSLLGMLATQSCPTICDLMDYSPPGSSIHGILQARIQEWVAVSPPGVTQGSNPGLPRCRKILYHLSHQGSPSRCVFHSSSLLGGGFPDGTSSKEPACQGRRCKRCRFDHWVRKRPWRRKWQPTPVF